MVRRGVAYRRRDPARCSGCGQSPKNPIERAEVAMTWLIPGTTAAVDVADPDGGLEKPDERRFCRGCAPVGPVADLACVRCGDGPLLTGPLATRDPSAATVLQAWMTNTGWRLSGPVCPDCVGELAR